MPRKEICSGCGKPKELTHVHCREPLLRTCEDCNERVEKYLHHGGFRYDTIREAFLAKVADMRKKHGSEDSL